MSGQHDRSRAERMARDIDFIRNAERWPLGGRLPVKTQPWVTEASGIRFGMILADDRLTVIPSDDGEPERFGSIEELAGTWSVD